MMMMMMIVVIVSMASIGRGCLSVGALDRVGLIGGNECRFQLVL